MVERVQSDALRAAARTAERPVGVSGGPKIATETASNREDAKPVNPPAADAPKMAPPEPLEKVVTRINEYLQEASRNLKFAVSESTGRVVVTVLNPETDEVIRQIPPEEVMTVAERLTGGEESLFVTDKA
ncbi:flagellar protein FlaG [Alkalilimnicola sp. S0819]|uniref:flagellar protein FlaG n=1 Tax=Alkalilimnicola sp. S0819 TaxID=2613922 RepID=UPI001261F3EC|nr:flagellar protein FlaG [Alkalilimnicola sp. S0819]KAB7627187.1 flagellar protein FlaG [Alkalilimnicola sp. S0819]MPQ15900.1 flagellar biosynthesis protein FlaG [Alkalilimnicola sp. S0819]